MVFTLHHWVINSSQKKFIHHSQKGYKYGNSNQKNRGYVSERLAISQNGALRWLDPAIFLFLYAPYQQCGTIWKFHASMDRIRAEKTLLKQFGTSTLPWREKIPYCEDVYKRLGTPAIFKISPLVSPDFDYMLENRGYSVQHVTNVMSVDLDKAVLDTPVTDVLFTDEIPDFWIRSLFDLKGTTNPIHRTVVPSMYRAILKETVCASITKNGQIIATGLGILDRDYIGIYAIHVREDYRRRGYARQIVSGLLKEGKKRGASHAYLQVVKNNDSAEKLYSSLGFRYFYTYWFRVQPVETRFQ